jgi:hypothetical protein
MASYERMTAAGMKEVLDEAEKVMTARLPIAKTKRDRHSATFVGGDGMLTLSVHRHGLETQVIARTDQVRTSRLDTETQYFLGKLPYQPGNEPFTAGDQA